MNDALTLKNRPGDARREALVLAAAEAIWLDGFAASSLAKIAGRADVPVGNVYYYYKTKADIALAVADLFVAQTQSLIDDITSQSAKPKERLSLLVEKLRSSQSDRVQYGCPIYSAVRDFQRPAPSASSRAAESFELLSRFVADELKRNGVRPSIANLQARNFVGIWQGGIALSHALGESPILTEAFVRMDRLIS